MSKMYQAAGISRQAHAQAREREKLRHEQFKSMIDQIDDIREDHPRMGMERLYDKVDQSTFGRDRFVAILRKAGYKLSKQRNYKRTTHSIPHLAYKNLIEKYEVTGPNQVWVSDITYYRCGSKHYYLTFILDVYTRRIVGYAASDSLAAKANVKAFKRATRLFTKAELEGLIHHSDRGVQYVSKIYTELLRKYKVNISMGNKAWENAHAERINRTIKNDYLYPKGPVKNLKSLQRKLTQQVKLYNEDRPHTELPRRLSPVAFEQLAAQKQLDYTVTINY